MNTPKAYGRSRKYQHTYDTDTSRTLRTKLAGNITAPDEPWRPVVEQVPRHVLVPQYLELGPDREWVSVPASDSRYWHSVYADRALVTHVIEGVPCSSSTQPRLMISMLRALQVQPLHNVLEIGTGSGYNAALLAHRLGDALVTTVDVNPHITARTVARLNHAGYHPTVFTADGRDGIAERAPYHRIIATCSVPFGPWAWIEQSVPGALIVVPIGSGVARLTVHDGRAEGHFLPTENTCLTNNLLRVTPELAIAQLTRRPRNSRVHPATALAPIEFPLSLAAPGYQWCTWMDSANQEVEAIGLWIPDGSVAHARADGCVWETGPTRLWGLVEQLHQLFPQTPARTGFGLTVTPERQYVWHAARNGPAWDLPVPPYPRKEGLAAAEPLPAPQAAQNGDL